MNIESEQREMQVNRKDERKRRGSKNEPLSAVASVQEQIPNAYIRYQHIRIDNFADIVVIAVLHNANHTIQSSGFAVDVYFTLTHSFAHLKECTHLPALAINKAIVHRYFEKKNNNFPEC